MDTNSNGGFLSSVKSYAAHPFSDDMSLFRWFLWVGILIIFAGLWAFMIRSITAID